MPRKPAIRTVSELSRQLRRIYLKQDKTFRNAILRPAVAALAAERSRSYTNDMRSVPVNERYRLLQLMPSYESLTADADKDLRPSRQMLAQTARAKKSRKISYRIGAPTCQGVDLPPGIEPVRLPLTIDGFIVDFLNQAQRPGLKARQLWNELRTALKAIASSVSNDDDANNPRNDALNLIIQGHSERVTFVKYQKLFSKARKYRKALG